MALVGLLLCSAAALGLRGTPLLVPTIVLTVVAGVCLGVRIVVTVRGGSEPPRALTAMQHIAMALGGFFLFVAFSLP